MKTPYSLLIMLVVILCSTGLYAADYASISGTPLSALNKQTDKVQILFDISGAQVNDMPYQKYLATLNLKQRTKYDNDILKVRQSVVKQFNKLNKSGFSLATDSCGYVAKVSIGKLSFCNKKCRAKISATIYVYPPESKQAVTQIKLSDFEGARKSGIANQLIQLSKDILEYIAIYL